MHATIKTVAIAVTALIAAFILGWLARDLLRSDSADQIFPDKMELNKSAVIQPDKKHYPETRTLKSGNTLHSIPDITNNKEITAISAISALSVNHLESIKIIDPVEDQQTQLQNQAPVTDTILELQLPIQKQLLVHDPSNQNLKIIQESSLKFAKQNVHTRIPFKDRWILGLIVSPEYSSVRPFNTGRVSAAYGGQLSYSISPAWSVSAGVIYSNKKYSTDAEYYHPPEGYWLNKTNGIIPDNIFGSCRVIDIPVMATFQFVKRDYLALTASAGIGSYFLLDESYDFEFKQNNPGAKTNWQTGENTSAAFSIFNIGMGIEFKTSRKTMITVEPIMKIPLKQMGWAKVNLYSMGLYFKLRYRIAASSLTIY